MRPADLLRLLLVLSEVPGGVEELLGDDRRSEPRVGEQDTFTRLVGPAALEVLAHRGHVENGDLVALQRAHAALVAERDEPHG